MIATILLVEADANNRAALGRMLRRAGYHLLTAPDRTTGYQTAVDDYPDLVIINLRGDEGARLRRELSADARVEDTPILFMSAAQHSDVAAAVADAEHYLAAPVPLADLLGHIDTSLRTTYAVNGS